ncbi:MAG: PfkB family carbohydrate kinase [Bacillota bacterium]
MALDTARPGVPVPAPAQSVLELLEAARGRRIAVIGDAVLDRYVYGEPVRISREAPVLILSWVGEEERPGGAANAAANAAALGARVELVSLAGDDAPGGRLTSLLEARGVAARLVRDPARPTTVKTRFIAGSRQTVQQQILRLDRWESRPPGGRLVEELAEAASQAVQRADAVILSEYGAGSVTGAVFQAVRETARARGIPVVVDSRFRIGEFRGVYAATPNLSEAEQAVGIRLVGEQAFAEAGRRLLEQLQLRLLVLTRGEEGMSLFFADGRPPLRLLAYKPREVYDVSGAGDTVVSAIALGLACGEQHALSAALLADVAAGLVVGKRGVATVSPEEIRQAVASWTPQLYECTEAGG